MHHRIVLTLRALRNFVLHCAFIALHEEISLWDSDIAHGTVCLYVLNVQVMAFIPRWIVSILDHEFRYLHTKWVAVDQANAFGINSKRWHNYIHICLHSGECDGRYTVLNAKIIAKPVLIWQLFSENALGETAECYSEVYMRENSWAEYIFGVLLPLSCELGGFVSISSLLSFCQPFSLYFPLDDYEPGRAREFGEYVGNYFGWQIYICSQQ